MADERAVLLIDPDTEFCQLVSDSYLSGWAQVIVVPSIEAARPGLDGTEWSAVLLALEIPPHDGLESVRALCGSGHDRPTPRCGVVVLTEGDPDPWQTEAIRAGADTVIGKPSLHAAGLQRTLRAVAARADRDRDSSAAHLSAVLRVLSAVATESAADSARLSDIEGAVAAALAPSQRPGFWQILRHLDTPAAQVALAAIAQTILRYGAVAVGGGGVAGLVSEYLSTQAAP